MKHSASPLIWLCAASTVALGALTVCNPNGVYSEYIDALDAETPAIAAVFTAAQDGVFPWSAAASAAQAPLSSAYRPLTETVTDEEMRSSVGNNEPFKESSPAPENAAPSEEPQRPAAPPVKDAAPADSVPAEPAVPLVEDTVPVEDSAPSEDVPPIKDPVSAEDAGPEKNASSAESASAEESAGSAVEYAPGFVPVDASWFDDAVFIGDSHIEGFCDYAGLNNATYYYKRGLDIWSVLSKSFVGGRQTIPQALSQHQFGKIYIMLGINEIGCGTTESYAAQYAGVVAQLRELQPNALIYIQAIFHTSQKKSDSSIYNNDTINARNEAISHIADGEHVFFIDCNTVFDDENGALTPKYTGDGVHVMAPYYTMWRDYLLRFGKEVE